LLLFGRVFRQSLSLVASTAAQMQQFRSPSATKYERPLSFWEHFSIGGNFGLGGICIFDTYGEVYHGVNGRTGYS